MDLLENRDHMRIGATKRQSGNNGDLINRRDASLLHNVHKHIKKQELIVTNRQVQQGFCCLPQVP